MCAMLLRVLLLCVVGVADGVDVAKCSNGTQSVVNFTQSKGAVRGRYNVQLCTAANHQWTGWELDLHYNDTDDSLCRNSPQGAIFQTGAPHSHYKANITFESNCSYICLESTLDLVFSACYSLTSRFMINNKQRNQHYNFFNITNDLTLKQVKNNRPVVDVTAQDEENVTFLFHMGIPFSVCTVTICKVNRQSNLPYCLSSWTLESSACSAVGTELRCDARLQPATYYEAYLSLRAPWESAFPTEFVYNHTTGGNKTEVGVDISQATWLWAAGCVLALLAAVILLLYCQFRDNARLAEAVLNFWKQFIGSQAHSSVVRSHKHVILLYAREGPVGADLVDALVAMFQETDTVRVHDIFSTGVVAAAAAAPADWLRAALAARDTCVLVLQTPALAALYQGNIVPGDTSLRLSAPLLGRRVQYRAPHFGDSLLQYGLRLVTEPARHNYLKYYVATLSDLPTEIFPTLVPYSRYYLPGAASLLCENICDTKASSEAVTRVETAATHFTRHAATCSDYLMDELLLV